MRLSERQSGSMRGQFIRKRSGWFYKGTEEKVVTDEKWLSFIIEQLLSNAVKYTAQGNGDHRGGQKRNGLLCPIRESALRRKICPVSLKKDIQDTMEGRDKKSTGNRSVPVQICCG